MLYILTRLSRDQRETVASNMGVDAASVASWVEYESADGSMLLVSRAGSREGHHGSWTGCTPRLRAARDAQGAE